jgi:hypothetical protein
MIGPGRLGNTGSAASGTTAADRKDESTSAAASTTTTSNKKRMDSGNTLRYYVECEIPLYSRTEGATNIQSPTCVFYLLVRIIIIERGWSPSNKE